MDGMAVQTSETEIRDVDYPGTVFVRGVDHEAAMIRVQAFPGVIFVTPGLVVNGVFYPLKTTCVWLKARPDLQGLYTGRWDFEKLNALIR